MCVVFAAATGLACESDPLMNGSNDPRIKLDAGNGGFADARVRDAAVARDAEPEPDRDAGVRDIGGGRDAAAPDAMEPECVCPTLPATCTPVTALDPKFGPPMLDELLSVIACAESSLHIAVYETTWSCVVDALFAKLAADPDIVIELAIDDDQCPLVGGVRDCELQRLANTPRVSIVDDGRSRYMHHKYVIADGREVWISSSNFTRSSFCGDENNSMVIREPAIVTGYETEFQRMFGTQEFGPIAPRAAIEGGGLSLYFSPETPVGSGPRWFDDLVTAVDTASTSVDFMIFALTRFEVSNALVAAHQRGVAVRGLVAPEFRGEVVIDNLLMAQVPVRVARVHSKVMIIDGRVVATGSPNWSENSWGNNEASLWISDPGIAAIYSREMDRIWATGTPP